MSKRVFHFSALYISLYTRIVGMYIVWQSNDWYKLRENGQGTGQSMWIKAIPFDTGEEVNGLHWNVPWDFFFALRSQTVALYVQMLNRNETLLFGV